MPGPWREVVHIAVAEPGPRGARPWVLTLSCGHTAVRTRGDTNRLERAVQRLVRLKVYTAPKRVRCIMCDYGLRACPEVVEYVLVQEAKESYNA